MLRLIRILLLWLMMAALPMQGMAAQPSCEAKHHAGMAGQDCGHRAGMDHQPPSDPHMAVDTGTASDDASHHPAQSSSCSACAACCTGIAPPAGLAAATEGRPGTAAPASDSPLAGFIPAAPEHPPKRLPA